MTQMVRTTHTLAPSSKLMSLDAMKQSPFLVLDASGSMGTHLRSNMEMRRIDRLREAVAGLNQQGIAFRQLVFDTTVTETPVIYEPRGGTAMHLAINEALDKGASKIVIVSDGQPDDQVATLAAGERAKAAGVKIDGIFCGDEGDPGAEFLRRLAEMTGGRGDTVSLDDEPAQLTGKTMLMLGDGSPSSRVIQL